MSTNREKREQRDLKIKRTAVSVVMFMIAAGAAATYGMYQKRKAAEAVIYEQNAGGGYEEAGGIREVYLADDAAGAGPGTDTESVFNYYMAGRDAWEQQEDGTVLYQGKRYRRASNVKAILAVGVDRSDGLGTGRGPLESGQNDVDLMIAQDTARRTIRILMIPRNSVAEMRVSDENGVWTGRDYDQLCLAYAHGDGGETSVANTIDAVSGLLCGLKPDHYAFTDMGILEKVNDAVGGVQVTIPNEELVKADPAWTKGSTVTLKGREAERFIRYRDTDSANTALYRMQQHRAYMVGFYNTLSRQARVNSSIVTDLYDLVSGELITDLKKDEFLKLAMDAVTSDNLSAEDILTLPGAAIAADGEYEWDRVFVDYSSAIPMILELFYREI